MKFMRWFLRMPMVVLNIGLLATVAGRKPGRSQSSAAR